MKILGLIPARGGSKGVPRKNLKLLAEKPLIQYSIEVGLLVPEINRLVVSTEDEEIAQVAERLGAEVPFRRPLDLAADASPTLPVVQHAINFYQQVGKHYDLVCLLQPTSPFRTPNHVKQAIQIFINGSYDSLVSVTRVPSHYNPYWVFVDQGDGHLQLATGDKKIISRRQELPPAFIRNGAIYLSKTNTIMNESSLYGDKIGYFEMSPEDSINIDTVRDFELAEERIRKETKA